jgi:hypothetical protein
MPEFKPKPRWYHLSPDRLIFGLLAAEGFLLLSEQFQWFAFNEKKGWTVLIAVAAVCVAVVTMLLWLAASFLFRLRFQFSVRSLVVLVVAVAVPLGWFGMKMREAERQRKAVEAIEKLSGTVVYDYELDKSLNPAWLRELVGEDFFANVHWVIWLSDKWHDHANEVLKHIKVLPNVRELSFHGKNVTDAGLEKLKGLTGLRPLNLCNTQVTVQGIEELRKALPNCRIRWDGETAQ